MQNKLSKNTSEAINKATHSAINNFQYIDQYVNEAEKVTNVTVVNCASGFKVDESLRDGNLPNATGNQFFNLIVLDKHSVLGNSKFSIKANLVLAHTEDSIRERLLSFNEQIQNEIKTYPTVICKLDEPEVEYGYLTNLELKDGVLDFAFMKIPIGELSKSILLGIHQELKIGCVTDCNELQEPHWAVKEADIIQILINNGFKMPRISF